MLNSNLYDCSDTYILPKGTITVVWAGVTETAQQADRNKKQGIFKNFNVY